MENDDVSKTKEAEPETDGVDRITDHVEHAIHHPPAGTMEADTPEPPTPEQRRQACEMELGAVLQKYGCRIVPYLTEDYVGDLHQKKLTTAMCGVVTNE